MGKIKGPLPMGAEVLLRDYRLAVRSREASVIGRKEVLGGRAKFGIFGDGKELAQLALARAFLPGDWRSGYYRDQTWMFALGLLDLRQYFAQLYADADRTREPQSGGRSMNCHFSTRLLSEEGTWIDQTLQYNSAADLSPTASQLPRAVGLAYASVLYRRLADSGLRGEGFSKGGNEVTWVSIGNASTAEGLFWESINAIGVLGAPAVVVVYDDGYGISVPNRFQMVKENIAAALEGFRRTACPSEGCDVGFDLYTAPGWDYPALLAAFRKAGGTARAEHIPALMHVVECTQPLGHSTSGSHERYKSAERLTWEQDFDCLPRFRSWLLASEAATETDLDRIEEEERAAVEEARAAAYEARCAPILEERSEAVRILAAAGQVDSARELKALRDVDRRDLASAVHRALVATRTGTTGEAEGGREAAEVFLQKLREENTLRYGSDLYSPHADSALRLTERGPEYAPDAPSVMGFELINAAFDSAFARDPRVIAFGEDMGQLGDVNQGFRGLQEKYGPLRISDTGIREATILGQAIGLALRGLRPIAEIQYLDYLLYALQILSDDLATLRWRTAGAQAAPVIVRTRGHRLEGIWHSGSPMGGILNLVRGLYLLVPRDFTRAAGFYNALLRSGESGIVVEVLNGYRKRERLPKNLDSLLIPPGICEVLRPGKDLTIVTYGATVQVTMEAANRLAEVGAEVEVIDVQSLLPFDLRGTIRASLEKTSRILFVDEDVPGGASAYMMSQVLDVQGGYELLDSPPRALSGAEHRPAFGSDGDYWSKPNTESVFDRAYGLLREAMPAKFPALYRRAES